MANDTMQAVAYGILSQIKRKQDQDQQKAINDILKQITQPTTETQERGATPQEILGWLGQESATPEPLPSMAMQAPPMGATAPSFMPTQQPPAYNPKLQTKGEAVGVRPEDVDPVKLGEIMGLTTEVQKQKTVQQMYQQMLNHPLINSLEPGQAQELLKTITGISAKQPPSFTLSPGQVRYGAGGEQIAEVPAVEKAIQPSAFGEKVDFLRNAGLNDRGITDKLFTENRPESTSALKEYAATHDGNYNPLPQEFLDWVSATKQAVSTTELKDYATESEAKAEAAKFTKMGYRGVTVTKTPTGRYTIDKHAPPTPPVPEKEKTPSFGQEQTIASVKSDLRKFRGTIYSPAGIPIPTEFGTYAAAMDYLSKVRLDPAQFKTELDIYKGIDKSRAGGMAIVIDISGNVYAIKPNEVRAYVKAGYTEIPK